MIPCTPPTLLHLTKTDDEPQSFTHWAYALMAIVAFGLALRTKVHPVVLLIGGTVLGWVIGAFTDLTTP